MRSFVSLTLILFGSILQGEAGENGPLMNLLNLPSHRLIWRMDRCEGCQGTVKMEKEAVQFTVTQAEKTPAQLNAFLGDLDLSDGNVYTFSGRIKASRPRRIWLTATIDEDDWHGIGLHEKLNVTSEYQPFEFTFRVSDTVRRKNRIQFILDHELGSIWVKDLSLQCK